MVSWFSSAFFTLFFVFVRFQYYLAALSQPEVVLSVQEIHSSTFKSNAVFRESASSALDRRHGSPTMTPERYSHNHGHGPVKTTPEPFRHNHGHGPVTTMPPRRSLPPVSVRSGHHPRYAPTHDEFRPEVLVEKLGADFDATWMSSQEPLPEVANASIQVSATDARLHKAVSRFDFQLRDDQGRPLPARSSTRRYLEKWLTERSSCPVQMIWEDSQTSGSGSGLAGSVEASAIRALPVPGLPACTAYRKGVERFGYCVGTVVTVTESGGGAARKMKGGDGRKGMYAADGRRFHIRSQPDAIVRVEAGNQITAKRGAR